jgi:hypothetical protein
MRRNAAFRLKPRRCRMLGGDRAHGPGPPRLERTSACAFAEHPADKLAHSLPGNSKHPGKLAPRPARQIVSNLRPSLSTMGNGEEDFSMKIQGTRSASAALALSPKSVGDPSGRNRPPVCGDDWSLENPFAGFGDRASPFFDVDNSGSPSNRPPATNFSATACAMLNSEKSEAGSRVQAQTRGGPRGCRRWIGVSTPWSNGGLEAVCRCQQDFTSPITELTIGRLSQDLRGDAIRTQSSLINGVGG